MRSQIESRVYIVQLGHGSAQNIQLKSTWTPECYKKWKQLHNGILQVMSEEVNDKITAFHTSNSLEEIMNRVFSLFSYAHRS